MKLRRLIKYKRSCSAHESGGSFRAILEGGWQLSGALVVSCESVNSAFNENQSVLGSGVLTELVEMFADADCLLDQVVEIFRELRGHSFFLQNAENLGPGDFFNLRHTLHISEVDADLRGGESLLGQFFNELDNVAGSEVNPCWGALAIRKTSSGDALALGVHFRHSNVVSTTKTKWRHSGEPAVSLNLLGLARSFLFFFNNNKSLPISPPCNPS